MSLSTSTFLGRATDFPRGLSAPRQCDEQAQVGLFTRGWDLVLDRRGDKGSPGFSLGIDTVLFRMYTSLGSLYNSSHPRVYRNRDGCQKAGNFRNS
jgi:hypothetical protein